MLAPGKRSQLPRRYLALPQMPNCRSTFSLFHPVLPWALLRENFHVDSPARRMGRTQTTSGRPGPDSIASSPGTGPRRCRIASPGRSHPGRRDARQLHMPARNRQRQKDLDCEADGLTDSIRFDPQAESRRKGAGGNRFRLRKQCLERKSQGSKTRPVLIL